jgi:frataxin-like iron-binding protein CyaY
MPATHTVKTKRKTTTSRTAKPVKKAARKKAVVKKDLSASYNTFKEFNGQQYTGVQIGRGHHWHYDQGDWKETKITPDLWEISYAVTKRRVGHAPENSGVPVGTEYHWYILANQTARKLNANDYATTMTGLKFKLAHKRADKGKWSASGPTQRKHLIKFLKEFVEQLEKEPVPIEFEYNGMMYTGEGVPVVRTCANGICYELDITLNNESLGIIRYGKSGWKMDLVKDPHFIKAIGEEIMRWFESE